MGIFQEARERLDQLTPQQWEEIASSLRDNPAYQNHQILENLQLTLTAAGIQIEVTPENARELLSNNIPDGYSGPAADKVFALSTNQFEWFEELQEGQTKV